MHAWLDEVCGSSPWPDAFKNWTEKCISRRNVPDAVRVARGPLSAAVAGRTQWVSVRTHYKRASVARICRTFSCRFLMLLPTQNSLGFALRAQCVALAECFAELHPDFSAEESEAIEWEPVYVSLHVELGSPLPFPSTHCHCSL